MRGSPSYYIALFVAVSLEWTAGLTSPRCSPADHICEGACPHIPAGVELPPDGGGLCLRDDETGACVCWMRNEEKQHSQTLFKCEVHNGSSVRHVMCLPPPFCFPPDPAPGCMIVLRCPCAAAPGHRPLFSTRWRPVVAFLFRSRLPVLPAPTREVPVTGENSPEKPPAQAVEGGREFSLKHLLFLLAFVVAPLLCWCMLTFFHEGRCRKRVQVRRAPEAEPMRPNDAVQEEAPPQPTILEGEETPHRPTAPPKMASPPPYTGERCPLAEDDLGPPPSYEEAVREPGPWWPLAPER